MKGRFWIAGAQSLWRGQAARQALWLALPFGAQQAMRLGTSIILARLLAPEMFGVMVLINTLRTGAELLSDIGIGQSIIRSTHAHERNFLDTAWTMQFARGLTLMLATLVAAYPVATAYQNPQLTPIIAVVSLTFLFTGLQSPSIFVMQRDMRVGQRAAYDLADTILATAVSIGLAIWWGNVWALVLSLVISFFFASLLTYYFDRRLPSFRWNRSYASEIFGFGKWVFLSTAIFFAAMSIDRFYFSAVMPLALLGIYGVARTFAELGVALAQRLGSFLVFPRVVGLRNGGSDGPIQFLRNRRLALAGIATMLSVALAAADQLVLILYDQRYHAAAFILPILLVGVWFSVLSVFAESTMFGLDRPQGAAFGNGVKFSVLLIGLPLIVPTMGVFAGLIVIVLAEFSRWLVLTAALRKHGLAPFGDDVRLTLAIALAAFTLKAGMGAIGLVPTFSEWWALGQGLHR